MKYNNYAFSLLNKKRILSICLILFTLCANADNVMKRNADGTYVVNTTTLCNARGYRATTPLEVYIKDGKVVKVEALSNQETPTIFVRVKKSLLPLYAGQKLAKAKKLTESASIDGCTGATLSAKAVQKNIKAALDYYSKNKR